MSSSSAEKLVKQTIKLLAKANDLDYEECKIDAKKIIKAGRNFDESLLGMMEEMMDLGNVGSREEIEVFNVEVLKIYLRIKDLDESGSDNSIRSRVWKAIEAEFELSDTEESESEDSDSETEVVIEEESESEPETEVVIKKKKERERERESKSDSV
jgi:hypothetical protein